MNLTPRLVICENPSTSWGLTFDGRTATFLCGSNETGWVPASTIPLEVLRLATGHLARYATAAFDPSAPIPQEAQDGARPQTK